ncbi:nonaspanin (TM9SF) [Artemisia annua]|uniref:Nonaspanin (TM9SF) n=1 Tax=Artemisia annua TaxID=35608 RepID=A0A2U1NWK6_ARTAN|nr:nonaspanin (TM9SF) [Artemisia annua]
MALAGILPFVVLYIQIWDILCAIWGHGICIFYNSVLIILFFVLITASLVFVVRDALMTYFQLAAIFL